MLQRLGPRFALPILTSRGAFARNPDILFHEPRKFQAWEGRGATSGAMVQRLAGPIIFVRRSDLQSRRRGPGGKNVRDVLLFV